MEMARANRGRVCVFTMQEEYSPVYASRYNCMTCPAVVLNHALQLFRDGGWPCGIPDMWPDNVLEPFPLTFR